MTAFVTFKLEGPQELRAKLDRLDPLKNAEIFSRSLRQAATLIAANAKNEQIRTGGGAVHPTKLTNRTRHLRGSIGVDFTGLPAFVEVGTNVFYGAVHEFGGTFSVKASTVKTHQRSVAFGRKVKPFTVPQHARRAHTMNVPPRPFMAPALAAIRPQIPGIVIQNWQKVLDE